MLIATRKRATITTRKKKAGKILRITKNVDWWAFEVYTIQLLFADEIRKDSRPQREIALDAGMHQTSISRIVRGAWREPRFSTVLKVAKALGYKVKVVR